MESFREAFKSAPPSQSPRSEMSERSWATRAITVVSSIALMGVLIGVYCASRSSMFQLEVVEIADQAENAPLDAQSLDRLAAVPVGKVSLFSLDLDPIEKRLTSHPWVRSVRLQKQFPQTLSIAVDYREPVALYQSDDGLISYVDREGHIFGRLILNYHPNLPVFTGVSAAQIPAALQLLEAWERAWAVPTGVAEVQISDLHWDLEKGFRLWVTYASGIEGITGRSVIDLGQDLDADSQFKRLKQVFAYLKSHKVQAHQIWADAGKKIVVRTVRGS
jgi:cell division protein FtsQ